MNGDINPQEFYFILKIEGKIKEFEEVNLAELKRQLQGVEQQRQMLVASINQVEGAIIGGKIMIDEELSRAGVTYKEYEELKAHVEAAKQEREGQNDETVPTTDDNSGGSERQ